MENPKYYLPIMPYLILNDAVAFLEFAKVVFNAEQQMIVREENSIRIRHGEITIGKAAIMFGNSTAEWRDKSASMFLFVENVDEVLENAKLNDCKILNEASQQEYGYSAGFEDPFGNLWWITQIT